MQSTRLSVSIRGSILAACCATLLLSGCSSKKNRLTFTSTPPATATAGVAYSYQATVTGSTNPVTYTLTSGPTGLTASAAGLVSWLPDAAQVGPHSVRLTATAGQRSGVQNWTITVAPATPARLGPEGHDVPFEAISRVPWRESVDAAGEIPTAALDPDPGFVVAFSWIDDVGLPDLASRTFPEWNSWHNPETRADYIAMVSAFAHTMQPRWLYLGEPAPLAEIGVGAVELAAWSEVVSELRVLIEAGGVTTVLPR